MKATKRILATLMTIIMLVGLLAVPAMAALSPMTDTGTVTITNASAGATYTLYRVFDLYATDCSGSDHVHHYLTNDTWTEIETAVSTYVTADTDRSVTKNTSFTDAEFLNALTGVNITNNKTVKNPTSSGSYEIPNLQYGYYVMKAERAGDTKYTVFTLCSSTLNITEKVTNLPHMTKAVEEDSKPGVFVDGGGNAIVTNTADIGQTVNFQIILTADAGTDSYTVTDEMPNFTNLKIDTITWNGGSITKDTDYTLTTTNNSFTLTLKDDFRAKLEDNQTITIKYNAKLKSDAATATAHTNTAVFRFETSDSEIKTTSTYTYQIDVTKTDSRTGVVLADAEFQLKNTAGKYAEVVSGYFTGWSDATTSNTTLTSNSEGKFSIIGLDADTYTLVETKAPTGYIKADPKNVTITNANAIVQVENTPGELLPETGGMGTTLFYVAGGVLVLGAFVVLMKKRGEQK